MQDRAIQTNGITLHVVEDGPQDGLPVILLHGFPEFWYGWRGQISVLANTGYRVIAPDQRGYNLSDKPKGVAAYNLDLLAADVVGLIDSLGRKKVFLVGHDWGATVAWWTALKYPDRLEKLVILNVPHPAVFQRHLRTSFSQMRKSWYMFFFQLPWLPEYAMGRNHWQVGKQSLVNSRRPGTFSEADLEKYVEAWSRPGAFTSMVNYYRFVLQKAPKPADSLRIVMPTLLIWGAQDKFLGREMAQPSIDLCNDGRLVFIEEATHWVQHEEADRVNDLLCNFLI